MKGAKVTKAEILDEARRVFADGDMSSLVERPAFPGAGGLYEVMLHVGNGCTVSAMRVGRSRARGALYALLQSLSRSV